MNHLKNIVKSLAFKPLESLVGCAEYIYTLHSKSGNKMLFFVVMIFSSILMLFLITNPLNLKNIGLPSVSTPQFLSFTPKANADSSYDPLRLLEDVRTNSTDVLIVDVRSRTDFDAGHIKNAIHIPVGKNSTHYPTKEEMSDAVKEIKNVSKDKDVVLYGHFQGTAYVQELAQMLRKKRVNASALAIGWNEWYHFRNLWLPESQWNTIDMNLYVQVREE